VVSKSLVVWLKILWENENACSGGDVDGEMK
jgi:hypothetical protein